GPGQERQTGIRLCVRVRTARVPDAWHLLRGAAAPERRRVSIDPPPRRRLSRRADRQGGQGAGPPWPQDPETRRCSGRGGGETEGARVDQSVPEVVRRLARELHALLEGDDVRLRRGAGQDHRERGEVHRRSREAGGRGTVGGRRRAGRGVMEHPQGGRREGGEAGRKGRKDGREKEGEEGRRVGRSEGLRSEGRKDRAMRRMLVVLMLSAFSALSDLPGPRGLPGLPDLLAQPAVRGPEHGALVIVGGGRVGPEILTRFFDLAGGRSAPLVVIPTAAGADRYPYDWSGLKMFKDFGATNITVLH